MEPNPYESPKHDSKSDDEWVMPPPRGDWGTTFVSIIQSIFVVLVSGVLSELMLPLELPQWANVALLLIMIAAGLSFVWFSHWAVLSDRFRSTKR